jgi:hypothetical protein
VSGQLPEALRTAAAALLADAPMVVLRRVLRDLLAEPAETLPPPLGDNASEAGLPSPSPEHSPDFQPVQMHPDAAAPPTRRGHPRPAARGNGQADKAAWLVLREAVRSAMRERKTSYAALAQAIGRNETTTRCAIMRQTPATKALQRRLRTWLETAAPEVAVSTSPFRGRSNGAGGADHVDTTV